MRADETPAPEQRWRVEYDECLRKFVETVALDKNEMVDTYMQRYRDELTAKLEAPASR
jgi:hypothetical protein